MTSEIKKGQMVVTFRRQIGLFMGTIGNKGQAMVQLGPDGPCSKVKLSLLRHATHEEIIAAGLGGVGLVPSSVDDGRSHR